MLVVLALAYPRLGRDQVHTVDVEGGTVFEEVVVTKDSIKEHLLHSLVEFLLVRSCETIAEDGDVQLRAGRAGIEYLRHAIGHVRCLPLAELRGSPWPECLGWVGRTRTCPRRERYTPPPTGVKHHRPWERKP